MDRECGGRSYDRAEKRFIGPGAARRAGRSGRGPMDVYTAKDPEDLAGMNTTVAVVATDAMLDKEGAIRSQGWLMTVLQGRLFRHIPCMMGTQSLPFHWEEIAIP